MREPPVVVAAEIHVEHIDARLDKIFHIVERFINGAAVFEAFKRGNGVHALAVGLFESAAQIDAVHDREPWAGAFAHFLDDVDAEELPVGIFAELAVVERGVGELIDEIAFVTVQVHAVDAHRLGVRRALTEIADDLVQLKIGKGTAGNARNVKVRVPGGGHGQRVLCHKALRVADTAESGSELDENAAVARVNALRQITPSHEVSAGVVNAGEVGEIALFRHGRVDMVADRDKTRGEQTDTALGAGEEVLAHLVVRAARLLGHLAVAHWCHHETVLDRKTVDLDGREHRVVRPELPGVASGTAFGVFAVLLHPVTVAVDKSFNQCIGFQIQIPLSYFIYNCSYFFHVLFTAIVDTSRTPCSI